MTLTPLVRQVAAQIIDYINSLEKPAGATLSERYLAARLRVSRGPVRKALQWLYQQEIVVPGAQGGFAAKGLIANQIDPDPAASQTAAEELYQKIAAARLTGELNGRISENELLRRYQVSRPLLTRVLQTH